MNDQQLVMWTERLRLGIKQLDDQHLHMVTLINRLHKFKISTSDDKDVRMLLSETVDYADRHFGMEEAAMHKAAYSGLAEHVQAHQWYRKNVVRMVQEHKDDPSRISDALYRYLKEWWLNHILTMDVKFAESMRNSVSPIRWLW